MKLSTTSFWCAPFMSTFASVLYADSETPSCTGPPTAHQAARIFLRCRPTRRRRIGIILDSELRDGIQVWRNEGVPSKSIEIPDAVHLQVIFVGTNAVQVRVGDRVRTEAPSTGRRSRIGGSLSFST